MNLSSNKGKNSLEARRALKNMFDNSYNQICSLENAGINPHSYYSLPNVGPIANKIYKPRSNRNGVIVKLPVPITRKYAKFSLPLNIIDKQDLKELRNKSKNKGVQSLAERSSMNRSTLEIFVDNIKVPDIEVFITVMDGTTDVYIPAKYFEEDGSRLDVIRRHYSNEEPYINCTISKVNEVPSIISLCGCSYIEGDKNEIVHSCEAADLITSKDDFRIYKNGTLLQSCDFNLEPLLGDYKLINLTLSRPICPMDTIEICVEVQTNWKNEIRSSYSPYVYFPNDILPLVLPISPGLCDIYVEGKRLFSDNIIVRSPRVLKIKDKDDIDENGNIRDAVYINDEDHPQRISVFMNYNGRVLKEIFESEVIDFKEDTSRYLFCINDDKKDDIFMRDIYPDNGLEWVKEGKFPCPKIIDETTMSKTDFSTYMGKSLEAYIDENAHNIIPLLSQYSAAIDDEVIIDWKYIEEYDGRFDTSLDVGSITYDNGATFTTFDGVSFEDEMVLLEYDRKYDTKEVVVIEINDKKVHNSDIILYDVDGVRRLYIKKKVFDENIDTFKISKKHLPIYNDKKNVLKITSTTNGFLKKKIDKELLGDIQIIDDILVFTKEDDGYTLIKNGAVYENDEVFLAVESTSGTEYLIVNSSFYEYREVEIKTEEDRKYITLDDKDGYPNCSAYGLLIFCNGEIMAENIDFFLTSQFTHRKLTNGRIVFKNRPALNSKLEIYFFEQPRITCSNCKILDSEYDVVYIRNLKAGFSTEYMDLYINNVKIPEEEIVEIALNMVLVKNAPKEIKRPFTDAFVRSKFKRNMLDIKYYIDYYLKHQSKWKLYLDRLIDLESNEILDEIIKTFADATGANSHKKELNAGEKDDYIPIIDEVGKHLVEGKIPRRIDANRIISFLEDKRYIQLMSEDDWENPTISINANSHNVLEKYNIDSEFFRIDKDGNIDGFKDRQNITEIFARTLMNDKQYYFNANENGGVNYKHYPNTILWDANYRLAEPVEWYGVELRDTGSFDKDDKYNADNFYDYILNPISRELYFEELPLVDPSITLKENYNIDANPEPGTEEKFTELTEKATIKFSKLRRSPNMNKKLCPDLDFLYTYDMKSFCAVSVDEIFINEEKLDEGQFTYSEDINKIFFNRKLKCDDDIVVYYTRKNFDY